MTTAINKFEQDLNNNQFKDKWHNNITQNNRKPLFSFSSVKQKLNIVESNKTLNIKNNEKNIVIIMIIVTMLPVMIKWW